MTIAMKSSFLLSCVLMVAGWTSSLPIALGQTTPPEKSWQLLLQGGFLVPQPSSADAPWQPLLGMNLRLQAQYPFAAWLIVRGGVQYNVPQLQVSSSGPGGRVEHWVYLHQAGLAVELIYQWPRGSRIQPYLGLGVLPLWTIHTHAEVNAPTSPETLARGKATLSRAGATWRPMALLGLRRWLSEHNAFSSIELRWRPNWPTQSMTYLGLPDYPADQLLALHWLSLNLGMGF